ncbi:ABC1 kinase family protein, partial [Acetobacterium sp.]|uniref:ABC1 kinase family protein n=1 Tax=Acetobacterium sp. TaxID=1872094 RepID=UPI002F418B74
MKKNVSDTEIEVKPEAALYGNGRRLKKIISILVKHEINKGLTPEKLRLIIEDMGPTFVKIGQVMSMRPDILPIDYCKELEMLRSQVKPMPYEVVMNIMKEEYGKPVLEVFQKFNKESLGSASIAQVHSAVLKDGSKVVVKVQRPGIYNIMAQDIALLNKAASILNIASGMGNILDFKMILDEIWKTAQEEMDFLNEAENAHHLYELNQDINYVSCPLIYDELTTSKVLVMEEIDGIAINQKDALLEAGYNLEEIGTKLAENYVKQIIDDGFFHADPHPGNIFIDDGKIVWIDLGMMGTLTKRDKDLFRRIVKAVATSDVEGLGTTILLISVHKGTKINYSQLYESIDRMLQEYGTEDLSNIHIGKVMEEMLGIAGENQLAMPGGVSMLTRGVVTIEGVMVEIAPEINIVNIMTTHMAGQESRDFDLM